MFWTMSAHAPGANRNLVPYVALWSALLLMGAIFWVGAATIVGWVAR